MPWNLNYQEINSTETSWHELKYKIKDKTPIKFKATLKICAMCGILFMLKSVKIIRLYTKQNKCRP